MTIIKSIEHFRYKLINTWKATKHDKDAFDTIANFVNDKHNQQLKQNELFAKLYIFAFSYYMKRYNCSVYDSLAQKELHKFLDKPLAEFIGRFTDVINDIDLNSIYKEKGLELKHHLSYTPEELEIYKTINFEAWKFEDVQDILLQQINNAINEFK